MSRPFIDPEHGHLLQTAIRLTAPQKLELARRGGSAYLRRVLNTPPHRDHAVEDWQQAGGTVRRVRK